MSISPHVVVSDATGERVLLVRGADGWALPRITTPDEEFLGTAQEQIGRTFGLEVAFLRIDREAAVEEALPHSDVVWLAETLAGEPKVGAWIGAADAEDLDFQRDWTRSLLLRRFACANAAPLHPLQAWQQPGWFAMASDWIREVLPGVFSIEQFAVWTNSVVLRVGSASGWSYFKMPQEHFHDEARNTMVLAARFPDVTPRPIAIDVSRGWMLLEDMGGEDLGSMPVESWGMGIDALAALHRRAVHSIAGLLDEGLEDRRPSVLRREIEAFAERGSELLDPTLVERLREAVPSLLRRCDEAAESAVPATLVHGDFHPANVNVREGRCVFFDWSDACVAHPFVDVAAFLNNFGPPTTDPVLARQLRDGYLANWADLVPLEDAIGLYERMEPLSAMHHALTYDAILSTWPPSERALFGTAFSDWIERALDSVDWRST